MPSRQERRARRAVAFHGLSVFGAANLGSVLPKETDITGKAEDKKTILTQMEMHLKAFSSVYRELRNNVAANLPQEFESVEDGLLEIQEILSTGVTPDNQEELKRLLKTTLAKVITNANSARKVMRAIIQECNQLYNLYKI